MTKRISKLRMPHPMPAQFAHDLAGLMLGQAGRAIPFMQDYTAAQILLLAWSSPSACTLMDIYRGLTPPAPLHLPSFEQQAQRSPDDEDIHAAAATAIGAIISVLASTENADQALLFLEQQVGPQWYAALSRVSSGAAEARAIRSLVSLYTGVADEPELAPTEAAGQSGPRVLMLNGGTAHAGMRDPAQMVAQMVRLVSGDGLGKVADSSGQQARPGPVVDASKPTFAVYERNAAVSMAQRMPENGNPPEGNAQQRSLLRFMADNDPRRQLVEVPAGDPLAAMYRRFPHFNEVLDEIRRALALAGCGSAGKPACFPPILLRGEPGTGKTYFAQELARVLQLHFVERDLAVMSEAFVITGQDAGWKNSKPGIVFDSLVNGPTANPLILLNEADKVSDGSTKNSPMAAMYALLEPESARRFADEFIPVSIDATRVNWILTANDGWIPPPVLTRLEVFDIRLPTPAECRLIAASVWESMCDRTMPPDHGFPRELGEPLLGYMAKCSPRVMRKMLTRAAGCAVLSERKHLLLEDLEEAKRRYVKAKPGIGFGQASQ